MGGAKGLKKKAQKIAQRHWEAQFREDFMLHLNKLCGRNNSAVVCSVANKTQH